MTSQLVIKLNKKKFKPLLDSVKQISLTKSYSELAGMCIWYCYTCSKEKIQELGNKTKLEFIAEKMGMSMQERIVVNAREFNKFLKNKKK